jgi:hypothetical protein
MLLLNVRKKKRQRSNGANINQIASAPTQSVGALKLKEARQYLGGLSTPTIHRLMKRGLLRPNRALRHLLFSREELDRFIRDNTT